MQATTHTLDQRFKQRQAERWALFCHEARSVGGWVAPATAAARALATAFGFSDFVAAACIRNPHMALRLINSGNLLRTYPDGTLDQLLAPLLQPLQQAVSEPDADRFLAPLKGALRHFRRREMVRIAVRDLSGLAALEETMADLSALAERTIDGALQLLYDRMCLTDGVPVDSAGNRQNLAIIGMGKLGAGELNFSSDVDLMFAYPLNGQTQGGQKPISNETFFTRLCRQIIQVIGEKTADGFVFRVDTRLRPYGDAGPLVMDFDRMEDYYQFHGREWERYALIKATAIAGDRDGGRQLLQRLRPFVYRRYLDFGVFESLREMKHRISAEVRRKKLHDNIKLGSGGIREVEFFGQMFQLIRGGVFPALQQPAIQSVLHTLGQEGFVSQQVCLELQTAYRFLRTTEHRLQAMDDQQTHALPTEPLARLQLARSMGLNTWKAYRQALDDHRRRVRHHFEGLLVAPTESTPAREGADQAAEWSGLLSAAMSSDERRQFLDKAGFQDSHAIAALLENFYHEPATRSLSSAGKQRLERLMPRILDAARRCEEPETVLRRVLQLLKSIQQRISYLSLLLEYPIALTHLIRLVDASPWITTFLSRHPVVLDELLDPRTLYTPPGPEALRAGLERQLASVPENDPEYQIEALCIFRQINTLRVAASDITNVLPLMKVSDHLSWIAEAILHKVVEISYHHLVAKHGRPACTLNGHTCRQGFAVIGYGKLGGIELGYGSDLDLVFLHAADPGETIGGKRPIDNSYFFARLGQRVVHMLSTHSAAGTLYETDMRLRPSGPSGLLVSHVNGFRAYQLDEAWTWEHQALIRARPITGDAVLRAAFAAIRRQVLCLPREPEALKTSVREMRERIRRSRPPAPPDRFDIKEDVGAMVDIEFLVQYLVLRHAADHPEIVRWTDNVRLLQALAESGVIDGTTAYRLRRAYLIFRAVVHRRNLQERPTAVADSRRFQHLRALVQRFWRQTLG